MINPRSEITVTHTWLTQKPDDSGFLAASIVTLLLAVASLMYWNNWYLASQWMPVSYDSVFQQGNIWQAFTALFAHADEKHLISNAFLFFILGGFLAGHFGLFLFPVLAFLFGGITNLIVILNMDPQAKLLGASGIVFWMGGAWLALYFLLEITHSVYQRSLRAIGVGLMLFFPAQAFEPQISYQSHMIGFILGLLAGVLFYFFNRKTFEKAIRYKMTEIEDADQFSEIKVETADIN